MPTYVATPTFLRELDRLSREQRAAFAAALSKFVDDLRAKESDPGAAFRSGLRVKPYRSEQGVMEMTWHEDGRALFEFGLPQKPGKLHVVWLRIGTHDIL